jgi:cell wall-associated NlpC family hydrolase
MSPRKHRTLVRRAVAVALTLASLGITIVSTPVISHAAPTQSELDQARQKLDQLEADFENISEQYNSVHDKLDHLHAQIDSASLVVDKIKGRMQTKQDAAVRLATELYMGGGSSGAIEAVLTSTNISDIEERLHYLQSSETAQSKVFERLASDNDLLHSKIAELEKATAEANQEQRRLGDLRSTLDDKVQSQQGEIQHLEDVIAAANAREAAAEKAKEEAAARAAIAAQDAEVASTVSAPSSSSAPVVSSAPAPSSRAQTAVQAALSQVGKPYQYGAAGPDSFDCSGLTMWSWAQAGISLPHNSGAQYAATPRVSSSDWQPGDLLFYGSPIHHVTMYIGNGQMVEAPYTGASVRVVSAYRSDYVGAGRPGV